MNQELLRYFQKELEFLSEDAIDFAKRHPETAGLLAVGDGSGVDPHVDRFISAFALVTASLQQNLDGGLPQISGAMLGAVFPYFERPVPSMAIVQLQKSMDSDEDVVVEPGTEIVAEEFRGVTCRFQTVFPALPTSLKVQSAAYSRRVRDRQEDIVPEGAASSLRMTMTLQSAGTPGNQLYSASHRFFLHAGTQISFPLFEMLVEHSIGMVWRSAEGGHVLSREFGRRLIQPVGFRQSEAALPWPARSSDAARLITEFLHFPQKFLFVDVPGVTGESAYGNTQTSLASDWKNESRLEVVIFFDRLIEALESQVSASVFQLGCTPIVNAFSQRTEPVPLMHDRSYFNIIADVDALDGIEILSVDRVTAVSENSSLVVGEFFEPARGESEFGWERGGAERGYDRKPCWRMVRNALGVDLKTSEVSLLIADPDAVLMAPGMSTLDIRATCLNGNLPALLPFYGAGPRLASKNVKGFSVTCLVPPCPKRPARDIRESRRSLTSLLSLLYLPQIDPHVRHARLRETLVLHNRNQSPEITGMIDGLIGATCHKTQQEILIDTARVFCEGHLISLEIDSRRYPGGSSYLFCLVLSEFFARSCSMNSFCRLDVRTVGKGTGSYSFPAASGEQKLVSVL